MNSNDHVTLIVGDMHVKQKLILPMIDTAIKITNAKRVVLCGDYMDDWGADDELALDAIGRLSAWLADKQEGGIDVTTLVGNHDFCYLGQFIGCGTQGTILAEVKDVLDSVGLRAAAVVNGHLVTHAGLTDGWKNRYMPDVDTPSKAADAINEMLDGGKTWWRCLYEAGYGRGGDSRTPGPLWADASELIDDPAIGIPQIVGHTPMRRAIMEIAGNYDMRSGKNDLVDISFCDTFSLRRDLTPIGDGSILVVSGDSIKSIANEGLWRRKVFDYRIERGWKGPYLIDEPIDEWVVEELI